MSASDDDRFTAGRRAMISAFAELTTLALRAGVEPDTVSELHGAFFDGNVIVKQALEDEETVR